MEKSKKNQEIKKLKLTKIPKKNINSIINITKSYYPEFTYKKISFEKMWELIATQYNLLGTLYSYAKNNITKFELIKVNLKKNNEKIIYTFYWDNTDVMINKSYELDLELIYKEVLFYLFKNKFIKKYHLKK